MNLVRVVVCDLIGPYCSTKGVFVGFVTQSLPKVGFQYDYPLILLQPLTVTTHFFIGITTLLTDHSVLPVSVGEMMRMVYKEINKMN